MKKTTQILFFFVLVLYTQKALAQFDLRLEATYDSVSTLKRMVLPYSNREIYYSYYQNYDSIYYYSGSKKMVMFFWRDDLRRLKLFDKNHHLFMTYTIKDTSKNSSVQPFYELPDSSMLFQENWASDYSTPVHLVNETGETLLKSNEGFEISRVKGGNDKLIKHSHSPYTQGVYFFSDYYAFPELSLEKQWVFSRNTIFYKDTFQFAGAKYVLIDSGNVVKILNPDFSLFKKFVIKGVSQVTSVSQTTFNTDSLFEFSFYNGLYSFQNSCCAESSSEFGIKNENDVLFFNKSSSTYYGITGSGCSYPDIRSCTGSNSGEHVSILNGKIFVTHVDTSQSSTDKVYNALNFIEDTIFRTKKGLTFLSFNYSSDYIFRQDTNDSSLFFDKQYAKLSALKVLDLRASVSDTIFNSDKSLEFQTNAQDALGKYEYQILNQKGEILFKAPNDTYWWQVNNPSGFAPKLFIYTSDSVGVNRILVYGKPKVRFKKPTGTALTALNVSIFPNPIISEFQFQAESDKYHQKVLTAQLFSLEGKIIAEKKILTDNIERFDNLQNLTCGFYFLKITDEVNSISVKKIVKL